MVRLVRKTRGGGKPAKKVTQTTLPQSENIQLAELMRQFAAQQTEMQGLRQQLAAVGASAAAAVPTPHPGVKVEAAVHGSTPGDAAGVFHTTKEAPQHLMKSLQRSTNLVCNNNLKSGVWNSGCTISTVDGDSLDDAVENKIKTATPGFSYDERITETVLKFFDAGQPTEGPLFDAFWALDGVQYVKPADVLVVKPAEQGKERDDKKTRREDDEQGKGKERDDKKSGIVWPLADDSKLVAGSFVSVHRCRSKNVSPYPEDFAMDLLDYDKERDVVEVLLKFGIKPSPHDEKGVAGDHHDRILAMHQESIAKLLALPTNAEKKIKEEDLQHDATSIMEEGLLVWLPVHHVKLSKNASKVFAGLKTEEVVEAMEETGGGDVEEDDDGGKNDGNGDEDVQDEGETEDKDDADDDSGSGSESSKASGETED
ncbi:hypothetical protein CYMTET_11950 [Cymbomonas tetramitiformis]|uniref:Uncharacterized protein n=1 Tax=Cymbomonas tetramitiformis TaxID=36881 RepID=A0AAE0GLA0_9CHLO|nr:hypothetical protein CYMTET_11950 [Cymbomonas tetramitiformis]